MNRKFISILIIALLCSICIFAQQDSIKRTTTTVIFGSSPAGEKGFSKYNSNAIKLNILGLFSGMGGLNYERELSRIYSVEVGAGITFCNMSGNIWQNLLIDEDEAGEQKSPNFEVSLDAQDEDYEFDRRKTKIGTYLTVMPRYYYQEDGFDGNYIGINFQRRTYRYEAFGVDSSVSTYGNFTFINGPGNRREFEKQTIIALCWGFTKISKSTLLDFYTSCGVKSIKAERIDVGYIEGIPFDPPTEVIGSKMRVINKTSIFFEVGCRFGFWWK